MENEFVALEAEDEDLEHDFIFEFKEEKNKKWFKNLEKKYKK